METLIDIIQKHSLVVRCLPYEVVTCSTYYEGDEKLKYVNSNGDEIIAKREVIIQDFDLAHFQRVKPSKWNTDSPERRFLNWQKNFPNGRKLLKTTREVKNGGWWYVKEAKNTDSTIQFSSKGDDTFLAPTLDEAINLYLDSINNEQDENSKHTNPNRRRAESNDKPYYNRRAKQNF